MIMKTYWLKKIILILDTVRVEEVRIKDEEDLQAMYQSHKDREIVLWCEGRQDTADKSVDSVEPTTSTGHKRKISDAARPPPSKHQAIQKEVDEIFAKLSDKHGQQYTAAQYRLWTNNMLQVRTHRDYASPPQVPMFGFNSKSSKGSGSEGSLVTCVIEGFARALKGQSGSLSPRSTCSHTPRATLDDMGVSPIKCATLRSQYIEQLKQLHQLLELTAVTKEEYEQQKDIILDKMKKM